MVTTSAPLGFRLVPKFVKKGVKAAGRGVARGAKATGKVTATVAVKTAKIALMPLTATLKIAIKTADKICALPQPAIAAAAVAAGVPPLVAVAFCQAVRQRSILSITKLLPSALKIAAAAAGGSARVQAAIPLEVQQAAQAAVAATARARQAAASAQAEMQRRGEALAPVVRAGQESYYEAQQEPPTTYEVPVPTGVEAEWQAEGEYGFAGAVPSNKALGVGLGVSALAAAAGLFVAFRRPRYIA